MGYFLSGKKITDMHICCAGCLWCLFSGTGVRRFSSGSSFFCCHLRRPLNIIVHRVMG